MGKRGITNIMKSSLFTNVVFLAILSCLLCSCTTVTYPNGTTVTTPYVAPAYGTYYPSYYGPLCTLGGYSGGYYPVYGGGCYRGCNNYSCNNWCNSNGWNRGNYWNGGYRPACNNYTSSNWNGYRGH